MKPVMVAALVMAFATPVRADVTADVTKDYTAFVTSVAAGKVPAGVEVFIAPETDTVIEGGLSDDFKTELPKPTVSNVTVVTSKSGSSAWLVADLAGVVPNRDDKRSAGTLRTSAFLVHDKTGWNVRAADWSVAVADQKLPDDIGCGNLDHQWMIQDRGKVPKGLEPQVTAALEALHKGKLASVLSDDKRAIAIGSAPKDRFVGGAAIKKVFKKWQLGIVYVPGTGPLPAVAGTGPDDDLMWFVTPVLAPHELCTEYRTFFVLQREGSDWKIVHQHYSISVHY